ncbi:MAG: lysylphosphatidylglycerol synthase domain-containing protein [Coriobacteriales bacterium]
MAKRWNLILPLVVLCVVAVVVYLKRGDLSTFIDTVRSVQLLPFLIAFACLFGRYFTHAWAYKGLFRLVDEEVPYTHVVPLVFSVTFANDCAPTAGTAGSVLIAGWCCKQGMAGGKSVSVVFLEKLGYFGGFAVVMLAGVSILVASGQMRMYLVAGAAVMALMIAFVLAVLVLGYRSQSTLLYFMEWVSGVVNRLLALFKRRELEPWAPRVTASFHEAAVMVAGRPLPAVATFARFVLAHAFDCCCFIATGFAFGFTQIPFLIAGYVAGFIIATFILQTIGAVEVLIALLLAAYGAAPAVAAAMALCYRGLIFWVPFAIGAVCINFTGRAGKVFAKQQDPPLIS